MVLCVPHIWSKLRLKEAEKEFVEGKTIRLEDIERNSE
jgi:hypothetical protein